MGPGHQPFEEDATLQLLKSEDDERIVSSNDYAAVESKVKHIVKEKQTFGRLTISKDNLLKMFEVNFLVCQLTALALGCVFRLFLDPRRTSPQVRHAVELLLGVPLVFFCFGYQFWILFGHVTVGYVLIRYVGKTWMPEVVFVVTLAYLSAAHITRMMLDYGGYTMDITTTLMISVQKLTVIAYSLHDGRDRQPDELTPFQKKQAIREVPDMLSFYSYIFCFTDVMCGPLVFYNDYIAFIDGSCYKTSAKDGSSKGDYTIPSPVGEMVKMMGLTLVLGALMMAEPLIAPWDRLFADSFHNDTTFVYRFVYLLCSMTMHRPRYFFAWQLSEVVNVASGLGFNGYDEKGQAKWDLLKNFDIRGVELSDSLKVNIESWNTTTTVWLRHTVYDRAPGSIRTLAVFMVSAFWHGFYPGYYLTFLTGAILTFAARLVRRNVRPHFLQSDKHKKFYDCVTFIFVRFANCVIVFPHVLLEVVPVIRVYASLYFSFHIGSICIILYFTYIRPARRDKTVKKE